MALQNDWFSRSTAKAQDYAVLRDAGLADPSQGPVAGRRAPTQPRIGARIGMTISKRLTDLLLALVLLLPLGLVIVVMAVVLLIVQGRPVFYRAERMSAPGVAFTQYKLRSMAPVTDDQPDRGATGAHKHWRITRIGRFLRRTRIDELPQIWNILRGDMSFVGPRPPMREFVERFPALYGQVLKSRPGVTGLATLIYHRHEDRIMSRCKTPEATEAAYYRRCLPAKLRIDLIYQRQRTLLLDLWVIWHTVKIVLTRRDERIRRRKPTR
ncbi:sugar transferase [Paracoccus jiaweipingae]|uniref:sugar transferase n=1 Tax=unclassified Paracoccus (in: a-proteobacteria) TaxID=2688777 RepID=UPI0037A4B85D